MGFNEALGSKNIMDKFEPYLKMTKRCDGTRGCFANVVYKKIDNTLASNPNDSTFRSSGILNDGMTFYIATNGPDCKTSNGANSLKEVCGSINIDINGFMGPNVLGVDMFSFWVTTKGIIPVGTKDDAKHPLSSDCKKGTGWGCTGWALYNENLNYLKKDVKWD